MGGYSLASGPDTGIQDKLFDVMIHRTQTKQLEQQNKQWELRLDAEREEMGDSRTSRN